MIEQIIDSESIQEMENFSKPFERLNFLIPFVYGLPTRLFRLVLNNFPTFNPLNSSSTRPEPTMVSELIVNDRRMLVEWFFPDSFVSINSVVLYIHGGGWFAHNRQSYSEIINRLVDAGNLVLYPNYSLSPEFPFDQALKECQAVIDNYLLNQNWSPRIQIMGDSAGGNLAAVLSSRYSHLVDRSVLLFPVLDKDFERDSYLINENNPFLPRMAMMRYWRMYGFNYSGCVPETCPLSLPVEKMSQLPPTVIITGTKDVLHDEAIEYARRLERVGVYNQTFVYVEMVHDFFLFGKMSQTRNGVHLFDVICKK